MLVDRQVTDETIAFLTKPFKNNSQFETTWRNVEFLSRILSKYNPESDSFKMLKSSVAELIQMDANIYRLRIAWIKDRGVESDQINSHYFEIDSKSLEITEEIKLLTLNTFWIPKSFADPLLSQRYIPGLGSEWSGVYYDCDLKLWFISYTALILTNSRHNSINEDKSNSDKSIRGIVSADIDISATDINQCETNQHFYDQTYDTVVLTLSGTHKCHSETSQVSLLLYYFSYFNCTKSNQQFYSE